MGITLSFKPAGIVSETQMKESQIKRNKDTPLFSELLLQSQNHMNWGIYLLHLIKYENQIFFYYMK